MSFLLTQRPAPFWICFILVVFLIESLSLQAQPSGGPYGPIWQTYELPKAAHVYYVAPDGKGDAQGTALDQPTTLESAISRVVTGDAIIRERTSRAQGYPYSNGVGGPRQQRLADIMENTLPGYPARLVAAQPPHAVAPLQ